MSDDCPFDDSSENQASEPCLPDGIGLTVDDVRVLLAQKNNTSVPVDDPLLMVVTILNAFLNEQAKLQEQHKVALSAFMSEQTQNYVQGVEQSVSTLTNTLSGVTITGIQQASSGFSVATGNHRTTMYLCTAIMAISALLNVVVFVLR